MFSERTPNNNNIAASALLVLTVLGVGKHLCISHLFSDKCLFLAEGEKTEV